MRNIFMLYMPPGNAEAMVHYEDTIRRKVPFEKICSLIDSGVRETLEAIFGEKPIAVWGSRNSPANRSKFDKMQSGDEVLIVEGANIKLVGRVAAKTVSPALSRVLWQNLRGNSTEGWDLVYFIANPREIDLPFPEFCRLMGYNEDYQLQGFTSVANDRLEAFYGRYDDLYSILVALRQGQRVSEIIDPVAIKNIDAVAEAVSEGAPPPADSDDELPVSVSEHLRIQWTLLRFGRQAGAKVWAPRNDQSRITAAYQFKDFEPTFAAGLDTQVKYVENIDVVWKEEFRIDAAFEVENSTSIYSGLLRFADLTMVAPNSPYPLFIVAPSERRSRVREQLARPTFKHLKLADRVRFLTYEKVREVEAFVGDGEGLSVGLVSGKAEKLTV
jgi:hypothetical protein